MFCTRIVFIEIYDIIIERKFVLRGPDKSQCDNVVEKSDPEGVRDFGLFDIKKKKRIIIS